MADSTFVFLITTDNHLGFMEKDPRRGPDSFVTFEECLRAARVRHNVDAMLLGGDLFHENKPSLNTLTRSMNLFSKYVLGDKDIPFRLLSDPKVNFPKHPSPLANFQNPNLNVALPVFTIYGNHDDPVGGYSAIDILSSAGLVNFFGHVENSDDIVVRPILLQKGTTKVAIYGMGNVRDERLHRCFKQHKVRFLKPKSDEEGGWFNILILHQNRGVRSNVTKAGIEESMLKGFDMDLVIWGNEHEQLMGPQQSEGYEIIQPGSTVLTSLGPSESNPKMYGVLEVRGNGYRLTPYPLQSLRPVVRRTVELWKHNLAGRSVDAVERFLRTVAEDLIKEADEQVARIPQDVLDYHPNVRFPLMRISVDDHDPEGAPYPLPNVNRFGQEYLDVVVNADEVLRHIKPKAGTTRTKTPNQPNVDGIQAPRNLSTADIRTRIAEVLNNNTKDACQLLAEQELSGAVYSFVEKGEKDCINAKVTDLLVTSQRYIYKKVDPHRDANGGVPQHTQVSHEAISHLAFENKRAANAKFAEEHASDQSDPAAAAVPFAALESILHRPIDDGNVAVAVLEGPAATPVPKAAVAKRSRANPEEAKPKATRGKRKEAESAPAPQLALNTGGDDTNNILAMWGK